MGKKQLNLLVIHDFIHFCHDYWDSLSKQSLIIFRLQNVAKLLTETDASVLITLVLLSPCWQLNCFPIYYKSLSADF